MNEQEWHEARAVIDGVEKVIAKARLLMDVERPAKVAIAKREVDTVEIWSFVSGKEPRRVKTLVRQ